MTLNFNRLGWKMMPSDACVVSAAGIVQFRFITMQKVINSRFKTMCGILKCRKVINLQCYQGKRFYSDIHLQFKLDVFFFQASWFWLLLCKLQAIAQCIVKIVKRKKVSKNKSAYNGNRHQFVCESVCAAPDWS